MSNWTGELHLQMRTRNEKTIPKRAYFQGAFKVMRPIYHDKSDYPYYYILNLGGGYLDGDTYRMTVELEEDARLTLTTQAATKVYKTPNVPAYQEQNFHLEKGSYLEYLPDALIAYERARYIQKSNIYMDSDATLVYSDLLTPGWSPSGHKFSYDLLRLKTDIYVDDQLIACDHIKLQPDSQAITDLGFMEGYSHLGTFIIISKQFNESILDALYAELEQLEFDFAFGISELMVPGCSIRIMANQTQVLEKVILACHQLLNQKWQQKSPSFLRKY